VISPAATSSRTRAGAAGQNCIGRVCARHGPGAFTLVEVLVVVGIITVLLAILMPALALARRSANLVRCQANIREICNSLQMYAGECRGRFPPNLYSPAPGMFWYDEERAGRFLHPSKSVLACPEDDGGRRSYAMNLWASSKVDAAFRHTVPTRGELWSAHVGRAPHMILVVECWSAFGSAAGGWEAAPTAGFAGERPGQRFGAGGGIAPPLLAGRWGVVNCEMPYARHRNRSRSEMSTVQPVGSVNIGYADGHVDTCDEWELADAASGKSTGDSLWSPIDLHID